VRIKVRAIVAGFGAKAAVAQLSSSYHAMLQRYLHGDGRWAMGGIDITDAVQWAQARVVC